MTALNDSLCPSCGLQVYQAEAVPVGNQQLGFTLELLTSQFIIAYQLTTAESRLVVT